MLMVVRRPIRAPAAIMMSEPFEADREVGQGQAAELDAGDLDERRD